jgi:hypothetical protein
VRGQAFVYIRHARRVILFVISFVVHIYGEDFQLLKAAHIAENVVRPHAKRDNKQYAESLLHICNLVCRIERAAFERVRLINHSS